jgi:hypothetical protein
LTEAVCAGLLYACRNLQSDEAEALRATLGELKQQLLLVDDAHLSDDWRRALRRLVDDAAAHPMLRGLAARALHDQGVIGPSETGRYLSHGLSRTVPPLAASEWLDGFLGKEGQILLYDDALRGLIDAWVVALGADDFTALLPMLRRAFASIDKTERRRLLDALRRPIPLAATGHNEEPAGPPVTEPSFPGYAAALPLLLTILGIDQTELGR